jgi:hypothetical protein
MMIGIKNLPWMFVLSVGIHSLCLAEFIVPEFRGDPLTTYQRWQVFSSANDPNFPDFADNNPNGSAVLLETTGGAFITSGGNIYSFAVATQFVVTVPDYALGDAAQSTVVVQIRTLGATVDLSSVTWNGVVAESAELLHEEPLGGFGGFLRDWKFEWNQLAGNPAVNVLEFAAAGSSMSLDRLAVDTLAIEASPALLGSHALHTGFSGNAENPWNALDTTVQTILRGAQPTAVQNSNLITSSRGINGMVLDFENLENLAEIEFEFDWSPQGAFDPLVHPVTGWNSAPAPTAVDLFPDEGAGGSARVRIQWPDFSIVNRYLKVKILHAGEVISEVYLGHLCGKTVETSSDFFTVSFADISPIRNSVGQSVDAGSILDVNKDGIVAFADIAAMRSSVGTQLSRITIPASN